MKFTTPEKEIFQTTQGAIKQLEGKNEFSITFRNNSLLLNTRNFLFFSKHIKAIDLKACFLDEEKGSELFILHLPTIEVCWVLSLAELVWLKELIAGTQAMLDLENILSTYIYSRPIYA
ncbi:MAG: hypothetical protein EAZ55_03540 [Cytophagales bacterium]|nr:MAG: hypothetical protein EAZ55_03540 [Cytophagales bacterium]